MVKRELSEILDIAKPTEEGGCWATIKKRFHAGGYHWTDCSRKARPGKLTCAQHNTHEELAQIAANREHE